MRFHTEVVDASDLNAPAAVGGRGAVVYSHLWRHSQTIIRFAPGDDTYLATDPCPCGRTYPRVPEGILGRLDDVLVIRGANVFPSAIETAGDDVHGAPGRRRAAADSRTGGGPCRPTSTWCGEHSCAARVRWNGRGCRDA